MPKTNTLDTIENELRTGVPSNVGRGRLLPATANRLWEADFGNGLLGVVKVADEARFGKSGPEALARTDEGFWVVARHLACSDIVPVTVARKWSPLQSNPWASVQMRWPVSAQPNPGQASALAASTDGHRLAVLDYITSAYDRHAGNVLVDPPGRLLAIDNQYTFMRWAQAAPQSYLWQAHAGQPVHPALIPLVAKLVTNPPGRLSTLLGGFVTANVVSRAKILLELGNVPPFP